MDDIVKLDVGGTVFKTTKSALTKFDGFFRKLLETRIPAPKDESEDVKEIQKEAEYYLLDGLVNLCEKYQKPVELEYPDKFRYIKSDEEMFELVYKPKKPVLVIFGPVSKGQIYYPEHLDLLELQKKYASKVEFYIRLFARTHDFDHWHYKGYAKEENFSSLRCHDTIDMNDLEGTVQRMIEFNKSKIGN
ncbi:unnamed protein product [Caenorhabditis nigoni]